MMFTSQDASDDECGYAEDTGKESQKNIRVGAKESPRENERANNQESGFDGGAHRPVLFEFHNGGTKVAMLTPISPCRL